MNRGRGRGRGHGRGARGGRGAGGGVEEAAPEGPQPNVDMAAMNAMCHAGAGAAVGAAPTGGEAPISANDEGGGVA
jgi:hypothetical protein